MLPRVGYGKLRSSHGVTEEATGGQFWQQVNKQTLLRFCGWADIGSRRHGWQARMPAPRGSARIHVDIRVTALVFCSQAGQKVVRVALWSAAEMQAVDRGAAGGLIANRAELGRIEMRIAAIGEQEYHFGLWPERRQQPPAVLRLPIGGQGGDEADQFGLVFAGGRNQLATCEVNGRLIVGDNLKALIAAELVDSRGQFLSGRLNGAQTLATHAGGAIDDEDERAANGGGRAEQRQPGRGTLWNDLAGDFCVLGQNGRFIGRTDRYSHAAARWRRHTCQIRSSGWRNIRRRIWQHDAWNEWRRAGSGVQGHAIGRGFARQRWRELLFANGLSWRAHVGRNNGLILARYDHCLRDAGRFALQGGNDGQDEEHYHC